MNDLLVHPKTAASLKAVSDRPRSAVMLVGESGAGKKTFAFSLSADLLDISMQALDYFPHFMHIYKHDGDKDISIGAIREVVSKLKLTIPGTQPIKRIVLIEDAQLLSIEAQNSLLKVLEEPPAASLFILTVSSKLAVLQTIASRCQAIEILPVSLHQAIEYFEESNSREIIEKAWRLSGGNVGLMVSLINENESHPLKKAVDEAKTFLKKTRYQRLLMLEELAKDKSQLILFLDALERVVISAHRINVESDKITLSKKLLTVRQMIIEARVALETNVNPKITVTRMALCI